MLTQVEQDFIQQHLKSNTIRLVLNQDQYPNLDIKKLANQINIRKKATTKLPTWANNPAIFFPPTISWQQCSSEHTAKYKAEILKKVTNGYQVADITGGFGVDAHYLSQVFNKTIYIEQNQALTEIATYNNSIQNNNIEVIHTNSITALNDLPNLDAIYLDPARRNERQQKIITLEDSTPNIIAIQDQLLAKAKYVMVKTSPMLDIHKAIQTLKNIQSIHVVAVENECKELLFLLGKNFDTQHKIGLTCVNILKNGNRQTFKTDWNNFPTINYTTPKTYIYDANKSILKGNCINVIGNNFGFDKIAPNTQLLTSDDLKKDFHGRIFEVEAVLKPSKKVLSRYLDQGKANLIVRNFPESVANLRKKWKIKDGGNKYLYAVSLANAQKVVIVCKKIG